MFHDELWAAFLLFIVIPALAFAPRLPGPIGDGFRALLLGDEGDGDPSGPGGETG